MALSARYDRSPWKESGWLHVWTQQLQSSSRLVLGRFNHSDTTFSYATANLSLILSQEYSRSTCRRALRPRSFLRLRDSTAVAIADMRE